MYGKNILVLAFSTGLLNTGVAVGQTDPVAIINANLVNVVDGTVSVGTTILLEGDRFGAIGPSSAVSVPEGNVVDARGGWVMPGLMNMHVHFWSGVARRHRGRACKRDGSRVGPPHGQRCPSDCRGGCDHRATDG